MIVWGSVIYDVEDGIFKMWYQTYNPSMLPPENTLVCYAVSQDGIRWEKPDLGIYEYHGSKKNNIVFKNNVRTGEWAKEYHLTEKLGTACMDSPSIIKDIYSKNPKEQYKMIFHEWKRFKNKMGRMPGIYSVYSSDGLKWKKNSRPLVNAGDRNSLMFDYKIKKYVIFTRPGDFDKFPLRTVACFGSKNFKDWQGGREILIPDKHDPPETEFYGMVGFNYYDLYIGFLEMFHVVSRRLDTQLVFSYDGFQWFRTEKRQTFLSCGDVGEFDYSWAFPANSPPVRVGEELYIWYGGRKTLHWAKLPFYHLGAIGLSTIRIDGFCSLKAEEKEGWLVTKPVVITGRFLAVNVSVREGYLEAEIVKPNGEQIPGFSRKDFDRVENEDVTYRKLTWQRKSDLKAITGKPVRVKFYLKNAEIYSFWMSEGSY